MANTGSFSFEMLTAVPGEAKHYIEMFERMANTPTTGSLASISAEVAEWGSGLVPVDQAISEALDGADLEQARQELAMVATLPDRRNMPRGQREIYDSRLMQLREQVSAAQRIERVMAAGYEPYRLPSNWYAGVISEGEEPYDGDLVSGVDFVFNAPIPAKPMLRLIEAQKSGFFDTFLVGAPDRSSFRARANRALSKTVYIDPVIIGYMQIADDARLRTPWINEVDWRASTRRASIGLDATGVQGFLIAHWDLEKDLAHADE